MSISIHALLAESDAPPYNLMIHQRNFYPRSPCGERHCNFTQKKHPLTISIHALLAESDIRKCQIIPIIQISIHALLAESDPAQPTANNATTIFLSTLSLRRATLIIRQHSTPNSNFYPRSPCGERQRAEIHASTQQEFLSTLSLRRATPEKSESLTTYFISIHALLAESDE